jgi:hypothetical protein
VSYGSTLNLFSICSQNLANCGIAMSVALIILERIEGRSMVYTLEVSAAVLSHGKPFTDFSFNEGIVSDNKKRERKAGLCTACSSIDFEQFDSRNAFAKDNQSSKFTHKLVFLDRILRKKKNNSCKFCVLIYDAIAANDPFNHPAIKDHLPSKLAGMKFKQWAEGMGWLEKAVYKSNYPFGRSKDKVDIQQNLQGEEVVVEATANQDQLLSDDAAVGAGVATVGAYNAILWNESDKERVKMMATVGTVIPSKFNFVVLSTGPVEMFNRSLQSFL